ncbi:hypothetical protein [Acinetobacter sp. YH12043]|uniref:hypothetical protein n=1 Tax=Acinetobacter sp. YH12043 TaxID=2601050 RepID=UPI0015D29933|nr:hypothetical protein [Acinetobacter sp. YH12043]
MAMKQTQTKLFDFSDAGLDFSVGSKNLFPDRFKKMLSLGYNEQTVSSVVVSGDQVTFTYGGAHGYAADRVLKVNSGALSSINNGEFWIDSVTTNTVTITIDDAPMLVAGGFTTRIASLGWSLEYENTHIQLYKFKQLDESDVYARFCFQTNLSGANNIAVGVGRTANTSIGIITDSECFADLATCSTLADVSSNLVWAFTYSTGAGLNNYTYSQGFSTHGRACVVGSKYHFAISGNMYSLASGASGIIQGVFPHAPLHGYEQLKIPALFTTELASNPLSGTWSQQVAGQLLRVYVGKLRCSCWLSNDTTRYVFNHATAALDFLSIDTFNTNTASPLFLYEQTTGQMISMIYGMYQLHLSGNTAVSKVNINNPSIVDDIELGHKGIRHRINNATSTNQTVWQLLPIEEIKIA